MNNLKQFKSFIDDLLDHNEPWHTIVYEHIPSDRKDSYYYNSALNLTPIYKTNDKINPKIKDYKNLYLKSSGRSLGGTYGNCYDSELRVIEADPDEDNFGELFKVLEFINPDMTFLDYHTKVMPLIKKERKYNSDYYGGGTTDEYKIINLYSLWDAI